MLEDNELDIKLIQKTLSRSSLQFDFKVTRSGEEFKTALKEESFDLILCDYQLPDYDALKALQAKNEKDISLPFILISGAVSEEIAIGLVKEGADDYILKDRMQRLPFAVERVLSQLPKIVFSSLRSTVRVLSRSSIFFNFSTAKSRTSRHGAAPLSRSAKITANSSRVNPNDKAFWISRTRPSELSSYRR